MLRGNATKWNPITGEDYPYGSGYNPSAKSLDDRHQARENQRAYREELDRWVEQNKLLKTDDEMSRRKGGQQPNKVQSPVAEAYKLSSDDKYGEFNRNQYFDKKSQQRDLLNTYKQEIEAKQRKKELEKEKDKLYSRMQADRIARQDAEREVHLKRLRDGNKLAPASNPSPGYDIGDRYVDVGGRASQGNAYQPPPQLQPQRSREEANWRQYLDHPPQEEVPQSYGEHDDGYAYNDLAERMRGARLEEREEPQQFPSRHLNNRQAAQDYGRSRNQANNSNDTYGVQPRAASNFQAKITETPTRVNPTTSSKEDYELIRRKYGINAGYNIISHQEGRNY
eukprot:TRINITY_DN4524_c0_g1_i3.p1 TRINITY_DN4524_c0_g1~~TRINITY_DN4524_c0_g1_i3.p1  ORF type:complete len:338 (+),score=83.43 TRINITY_DN4524_c0_g1_i3:131-1144(+)